MSNSPIDITRMAQEARALGITTTGILVNELEISLKRDEAYLARREARGRYTPTDESMARTTLAKALCIDYLRRVPENTTL